MRSIQFNPLLGTASIVPAILLTAVIYVNVFHSASSVAHVAISSALVLPAAASTAIKQNDSSKHSHTTSTKEDKVQRAGSENERKEKEKFQVANRKAANAVHITAMEKEERKSACTEGRNKLEKFAVDKVIARRYVNLTIYIEVTIVKLYSNFL
jgi:hypothetical protein